jgi:hypothetical protein
MLLLSIAWLDEVSAAADVPALTHLNHTTGTMGVSSPATQPRSVVVVWLVASSSAAEGRRAGAMSTHTQA